MKNGLLPLSGDLYDKAKIVFETAAEASGRTVTLGRMRSGGSKNRLITVVARKSAENLAGHARPLQSNSLVAVGHARPISQTYEPAVVQTIFSRLLTSRARLRIVRTDLQQVTEPRL